ncbi:MAG: restriction endonuclease [Thermodesulfobacteriota bacterium]
MAANRENLLELLVDAPWWVSVLIAAAVFVLLKFVLPGVFTGQSLSGALAGGLSQAAWLIAVIVLIPAPVSAYNTWKKNRLLIGEEDASAISKLSRRAFAQLVEDLYSNNGYRLEQNADPVDQAEVDIIAENREEKVLVQYRHHKSGRINEQAVKAMIDRLENDDARQAHIISCSGFTPEAVELAADTGVKLLDSEDLAEMISRGQTKGTGIG